MQPDQVVADRAARSTTTRRDPWCCSSPFHSAPQDGCIKIVINYYPSCQINCSQLKTGNLTHPVKADEQGRAQQDGSLNVLGPLPDRL